MEEDIRLRSACDRCHSQKLRCIKPPEADICDRCTKARTQCAFSPFRQKKYPQKDRDPDAADSQIGISNSNPSDQSMNIDIGAGRSTSSKRRRVGSESRESSLDPGLDFNYSTANTDQASDAPEVDWNGSSVHDSIDGAAFGQMDLENPNIYFPFELSPPMFHSARGYSEKADGLMQIQIPPSLDPSLDNTPFSTLLNPLPDLDPTLLTVALQTPRLPVCAADVRKSQKHSVTQMIRKLSGLSLSLYEHSTTIPPPQAIHAHMAENESCEDYLKNQPGDYSNYKVDDTFQLTQDMVDIYPPFIDMFVKPKIFQDSSLPKSEETSPETVYFGDTQRKGKLRPAVPSRSNPLSLDHSSILLILSCHLRLIDVYEELFKSMQVCIDQKGIICPPQETTFVAPQLKIGNYIPPPTTAVPMQMLLLLHFATRLCDHAVELEGHIREHEDMAERSGSFPNDNKEEGAMALSLASAKKVKDRARSMLQHLTALRTVMLREGHLA